MKLKILYNKLLSLVPFSICPICSQRTVSSLDHYLPKSLFPSLVVAPLNLIPACDQCNKKKSNDVAETYGKGTSHPYFDKYLTSKFLYARVLELTPPVIDFYVDPPQDWEESVKERVRYHFDFFELNKLYSVHAGAEITAQIHFWNELSAIELKILIQNQARSREKLNPNTWQVAMDYACAQSDWFCEGGYRNFELMMV